MFKTAKFLLISVTTATILGACATGPTAYGPAQGSGLGFVSQQIEKDRFQISFTGRNADEARTFALLRAAELTKGQGYTHFRVIGNGVSGNDRGRSPISSSIGVGVGSGGGYYGRGTRTNVGLGIGINDLGRALQGNKITASIEILLMNSSGNTANGNTANNVYEADSVIKSVHPGAFTP